ncbi:polysaccharide deacetylase family protein [Paucibacter sp. JuS9]|uniref:polysaccharide deacetylase family protein n=1 Tax=Paucibacter sp. JuS9 TaxID=3228748 RepID=UPI003757EF1C
MSLDSAHLEYPLRRYGMDHERYDWTLLQQRPVLRWPGGKPLAVWINVSLQHFPLNPSAKLRLPGSMAMPYPDLRHFTLRDHGNRVGAWRVLETLDGHKLPASFAINAELIERCPELMLAVRDSGAEVLGHSWNMDTVHAGALEEDAERALIQRSLRALSRTFKREIRGWLSPGRLETVRTPELLREAGIRWFADWVNDELPYAFRTANGPLLAMPLPTETEDRFVVLDNLHAEASWAEQVIDAFEFQRAEARACGAGRLFSLSLHPWVTGQAHRVRHLDRVLAHIAAAQDDCWLAQPSEIAQAAGVQA